MGHYSQRNLEERLEIEVPIYDQIAFTRIANLKQHVPNLMGRAANADAAHLHSSKFPQPIRIWIDSVGAADTQFLAYRHISPVADKDILQFGGSGTHAVKFLLAGARSTTLLSPSKGELALALALARYFNVTDHFFAIEGVAEDIPIRDGAFDGIYGGGCLHHTDITRSLQEVWRVLRSNGRAAFVEPIETPLYDIWVNLLHGSRFLQSGEGAIEDRPFSIQMVQSHTQEFRIVDIIKSGGPLRYLLVALQRLVPLPKLPSQLAYYLLTVERTLLTMTGMTNWFGNMAILLTK